MRTLLIAIGNSLRGDDGAAHTVTRLFTPGTDLSIQNFLQLAPEVAALLENQDLVIFLDAETEAPEVKIEPLKCAPGRQPFTHSADPQAVLAIARELFGFAGRTFICRIPASQFSRPEKLSPPTEIAAVKAAKQVRRLIGQIANELREMA